jgi:hypothetical protein
VINENTKSVTNHFLPQVIDEIRHQIISCLE